MRCDLAMWIIGDIHGCLEELDLLLRQIPAKDRLLFIGDYIDRGPNSSGVVERLLREEDRSIYLLGNHEAMFLSFLEDPQSPDGIGWLWGNTGSLATLSSYGIEDISSLKGSLKMIPDRHYQFYRSLKLYYESEDFIAVHAGIRTDKGCDMKLQKKGDLIWIRDAWISQEQLWNGKKVYYGHTPSRIVLGQERQHEPIRGKRSVGIDTGCVFGGSLSALHTGSGKLLQVAARRSYL